MGKVREVTGSTLHGDRGGFMRLAGKLRYQQLEGRHYVVGGGKAVEYDTAPECYEVVEAKARGARDARLGRQAAEAQARRDASTPVAAAVDRYGQPLDVGARVEFERQPGIKACGVIGEIGARSVAIDCEGGDTYRRAPGDVSRCA